MKQSVDFSQTKKQMNDKKGAYNQTIKKAAVRINLGSVVIPRKQPSQPTRSVLASFISRGRSSREFDI